MSYSITFKPPKEVVDKYQQTPSFASHTEWALELLVYCLKNYEEKVSSNIVLIKSYLNSWYNDIEKTVKNTIYHDYTTDNEITFYGWEFSHGASNIKEELIDTTLEDLVILTAGVDTPNYFEAQQNFYDKLNDIKDKLTYFKEESENIIKHDIIEDLNKYEVKDEDSSLE